MKIIQAVKESNAVNGVDVSELFTLPSHEWLGYGSGVKESLAKLIGSQRYSHVSEERI